MPRNEEKTNFCSFLEIWLQLLQLYTPKLTFDSILLDNGCYWNRDSPKMLDVDKLMTSLVESNATTMVRYMLITAAAKAVKLNRFFTGLSMHKGNLNGVMLKKCCRRYAHVNKMENKVPGGP